MLQSSDILSIHVFLLLITHGCKYNALMPLAIVAGSNWNDDWCISVVQTHVPQC